MASHYLQDQTLYCTSAFLTCLISLCSIALHTVGAQSILWPCSQSLCIGDLLCQLLRLLKGHLSLLLLELTFQWEEAGNKHKTEICNSGSEKGYDRKKKKRKEKQDKGLGNAWEVMGCLL